MWALVSALGGKLDLEALCWLRPSWIQRLKGVYVSNDRPRADVLPPARPDRDLIHQLIDRPMPTGADELLSALMPPMDADETIYLSTPITTGPSLLHWLSKSDPANSSAQSANGEVVREEVIRENIARLAPLRDRVRSDHPHAHVIDPTDLEVESWGQPEYHRFWVQVIRDLVDRIVFADGWQLSTGCVTEYAAGLELGLEMTDSAGNAITPTVAAPMLRQSARSLEAASRDSSVVIAVAVRAEESTATDLKDCQLASLARSYNVASFVSFTPNRPYIRFGVLAGECLRRSLGLEGAIRLLLSTSRSGLVNVRTFRPDAIKGNPFYYGLASIDEVVSRVETAADEGYYCIVNETIDIHDGGVSGVTLGGIVEFAPDDTPRTVERNDTARLPIEMASHILRAVYGGAVALPAAANRRFEFSVHPVRVGHRRESVIVWEAEEVDAVDLEIEITWPNRFSQLIGDKTFGLLVADAVGVSVPQTTVINRRVAPFRFGRSTRTSEWWMRTAPASQAPGRFTTTRGWTDPFELLKKEDPDAEVVSVIAQESVEAQFSGATLPTSEAGGHIVEGVVGSGADFMLGAREVSDLPQSVEETVVAVLRRLEDALGNRVRIEWAIDEREAWVLQLHCVQGGSLRGVFNPGTAETWLPFDPSEGLEALDELIVRALEVGAGVEVTKSIGLTSHVGDLLRKSGVPGRLKVSDDS